MIRQAHTYLVGALSGVTLIGIAIGVFILLVSAQVFHEWPIADLGSHNQKAAVSPAKALPATGGVAATASTGATAGAARPNAAKVGDGVAGASAKNAAHHHAADPGAVTDATTSAPSVETASTPSRGETSSGGHSGSNSSSPSQSSSPSSSGGSSGSSGSSSGSASASGSSGSSSGPSGSGSGTSTGTTVPPVTTTRPPQVAATVNETVHAVDEGVLGGTLEKTGVTEVTEGVVNGVAGPESVVGKTVEGVGEVVGGLLGAGGH